MSDNPYAAPESTQLHTAVAVDPARAREVRQLFRGTERLVRSIALVYFVQAVLVIAMAFSFSFVVARGPGDPGTRALWSMLFYCAVLGALIGVAGYGLWVLATWSRLCALVQTFFLLGGFMFGMYALDVSAPLSFFFALLHSLPLYILFAPRAGYVLSPAFAPVVAATPGMRPRSLLLALLIVVLFVLLILADIVIGLRLNL